MSRSYKKNPFTGNTTSESEKQDKQLANRRFRRNSKQKINMEKEPHLSIFEVSNICKFAKDGKSRFSPFKYPYLMRK